MASGYYYFSKAPDAVKQEQADVKTDEAKTGIPEGDAMAIDIHYPIINGTGSATPGFKLETKTVSKTMNLREKAALVMEEFLKGPSNEGQSIVPAGARVLGIYLGDDGILYLDLSGEFKVNFQGDALMEFLLIKGMSESIMANVGDIKGIRILIDGAETETLGGHMALNRELNEQVSAGYTEASVK